MTIEEINKLQRDIIIHSIIYYKLDSNVWTDSEYDNACYTIYQERLRDPEQFKLTEYYEQFKDFSGFSGYHLIVPELHKAAVDLLHLYYPNGD